MKSFFAPLKPHGDVTNGFDPFVDPAWCMLPFASNKSVKLYNEQGLTITVLNPAVAKIVSKMPPKNAAEGREIVLQGVSEGTTLIEAKENNKTKATLEVSTLKKKFLRVAFNYVRDNAGHHTLRCPSVTQALIKDVNALFIPQANVEIVASVSRIANVKMNLKDEVNFPEELWKGKIKKGLKEWNAITKLGDPSAQVNVFFVHDLESDENLKLCRKESQDCSDIMGYHAFMNCMIQDQIEARYVGDVTAHEIGHALGVVNHNKMTDYLMHDSSNGILISKQESLTMNQAVKI